MKEKCIFKVFSGLSWYYVYAVTGNDVEAAYYRLKINRRLAPGVCTFVFLGDALERACTLARLECKTNKKIS